MNESIFVPIPLTIVISLFGAPAFLLWEHNSFSLHGHCQDMSYAQGAPMPPLHWCHRGIAVLWSLTLRFW